MDETVLTLAMTLGKVEESEQLKALCCAAREELESLLRPGMTPEECGGAFPLAAAWMALAALAVAGDDGVVSFTAGDVSMRQGGGGDRAAALRMQARQVMRPYLLDGGFSFRSVKG